MSSGSKGVGESSSTPEKAPGIHEPEKVEGGHGGTGDLMHTKVKTLGELKSVLIAKMGEKDGTKYYNNFIKSFALMMLGQVQEGARRAQRAAQKMRERMQ